MCGMFLCCLLRFWLEKIESHPSVEMLAVFSSRPSQKDADARIRNVKGNKYKFVIPNYLKSQSAGVDSEDRSTLSIDHSLLASGWKDLKRAAGKDGIVGSINYDAEGEDLSHTFSFKNVKVKGKKLVISAEHLGAKGDLAGLSDSLNSFIGPGFGAVSDGVSAGAVSGLGFSLGMPSGSESILSDLIGSVVSGSSLLKPFRYENSFPIPGADSSLAIELKGTPSFSPKLETPSLVNIADFDQYSFSAQAGFDWSGTLTVDLPSKLGRYSFSKSIELDPIHQDFDNIKEEFDVSAVFNPSLEIDLDFSLKSKKLLGKSLELSVGQDLDIVASVSTQGVEFENLSKPFRASLKSGEASLDDITGFKMSGVLTPDIEASAVVSAEVPIFGKRKVATVSADFDLPASLVADEAPSIIATLNGTLDLDVSPVIGPTISKDFQIGPYKSDNLLDLLA